ncbi:NACHT domain-containing protein [Amycolatopsis camponoti]|nr:hypothetical protein [Amycolatopsis camponoti]
MPSTRAVAEGVRNRGTELSHTTIAQIFSGSRVPRWGALKAVVEFLGGAEEEFRQLWISAKGGDDATDDYLRNYREFVRMEYGRTTVPNFAERQRAQLRDIFVAPLFSKGEGDSRDGSVYLDDLQSTVSAPGSKTVLLADQGAGKTMTCRFLMLQHAGLDSSFVPFYLSGREFFDLSLPLVDLVEASLLRVMPLRPPNNFVQGLLVKGSALIIIDGLDEVSDLAVRRTLSSQIESFCNVYPMTRVLVTSRLTDYGVVRLDPALFLEYRILPLSRMQAGDLVNRIFALDDAGHPGKLTAAEFFGLIDRVTDIWRTPLLLSHAAALSGRLPSGEFRYHCAEIVNKVVELATFDWDVVRGIQTAALSRYLVRRVLEDLALWYAKRGGQAVALSQVSDYISDTVAEAEGRRGWALVDNLVEYFSGRANVISVVGVNDVGDELYSFTHTAILAHMAASRIVREDRNPNVIARFLVENLQLELPASVLVFVLQIFDDSVMRGGEILFAEMADIIARLPPGEDGNLGAMLLAASRFVRMSNPSVLKSIAKRITPAGAVVEGYSLPEVIEKLELLPGQAERWLDSGEIAASINGVHPGGRYAFKDVLILAVAVRLWDLGVREDKIRDVLNFLRQMPLEQIRSSFLIGDSSGIHVMKPMLAMSAVKRGQGFFGIDLELVAKNVGERLA